MRKRGRALATTFEPFDDAKNGQLVGRSREQKMSVGRWKGKKLKQLGTFDLPFTNDATSESYRG
jgi:hypothetical protein